MFMNVQLVVFRRWALAVAFLSFGLAAHRTSAQVTIDWVTVGDPGNAADSTGYGAVSEVFQIMKFEWTNAQYVDFLNAVDPDGLNPQGIYNLNMGSDARGGITNSGTVNGSRYAVKANMGDKPVNYVSWFDAARVANWLHNGAQTYGASSSSALAPQNTGAYTLGTVTRGTAPAKNVGAQFFMPTENQWYKAAYYKGGGTNAGFWNYATQSDTDPLRVTSGSTGIGSAGNTGNVANYGRGANWNDQDGNVTTVGTNGSPSFYGAYDMNGNVYEWNDLDGTAGSSRGLRGGRWLSAIPFYLSSGYRDGAGPSYEYDGGGFRLAAVPEPSTYAMALAGLACGLYSMRRRRKQVSSSPMPLIAIAAAVLGTATPVFAQFINYEMVLVGDPGNASDIRTGYGAVSYEYQIGKYEVTIGQYTAFLNAVAMNDPNELYNPAMATDLNIAGISREGSPGSYVYSVIGPFGDVQTPRASSTQRPITYTSWFDAARFANWMSNGQPTGAQSPTTTENGAYNLVDAPPVTAPAANAINPNTGAVPLFRIPTENEWYKAAYYRGGGTNSGYWQWATQSNALPSNTIGDATNQANYRQTLSGTVVFAITQAQIQLSDQNYLTDVGAFVGSPSAYGTFDQSGNAREWNDLDGAAAVSRGLRGGSWLSGSSTLRLSSALRNTSIPTLEYNRLGFRLASPVPEPATLVMASGGALCAGGWWALKRRRRA